MLLYHSYQLAVPLAILGALYGFRWKVGMWGNCISLGAVLFSFLIAIGWWENLAYFLAQQFPQWLFIVDCASFFVIFIVALAILDHATRSMSTVKVKYADMVENIGNGIAIFLLSAALYGVYLFGAEDLGMVGEYHDVQPKGDSMAITALRILSAGNLSGFTQVNQFDDRGDFRKVHLLRRQALMLNMLDNANEGPIRGIQGPETLDSRIKWREGTSKNTEKQPPPNDKTLEIPVSAISAMLLEMGS